MTFSGTVDSDFLKLVTIPDRKKIDFINFAANDFLDIRDGLISYIKSVYPLDYQNFSESDLGMMLIELVSYMGAVNSLKTDMIANEHFIRTVKNRRNLRKLLELIGVRLLGPKAAAMGAQITSTKGTSTNPFTDGDVTTLTFPPANRVYSIISEQDAAPVSYTMYRVAADGTLEGLTDELATLTIPVSDAANDTSSLFSNIALVEGALTVQRGIFNTTEGVKTITLTDAPIVDGSVEVFVTDVYNAEATGRYREVPKMFSASGEGDKVFQTVYDESYGATVIFGDGILGISPSENSEFTIIYRVGGGSRGNLSKEAMNVQITGFEGTTSKTLEWTLENTTPGIGGQEAETVEHAKKWAPYTFKRQDRVVTLEDYITFANTFQSNQGTIGKATAVTRDAYSSANIIDVYVLEKANDLQLSRATPQFKKDLLTEIEVKKMLTDHVVIADGVIRTLDLVMTVRIDKELTAKEEDIKAQVAFEILDFFHVDNTDFGKEFISADLARRIFQLPDIRYATIDNIGESIKVDFNEIIQLNNFSINVVEV